MSSDRRTYDYVHLPSIDEIISTDDVDAAITRIPPQEINENDELKDLVTRFLFALDRRRRGLSIDGADMARDTDSF